MKYANIANINLEQKYPMKMQIQYVNKDNDAYLFKVLYSLNDIYRYSKQAVFLPIWLETMGQSIEYSLRLNMKNIRYYLSGIDNFRVYENLEAYIGCLLLVKVRNLMNFKGFSKNRADMYYSDTLLCSGEFTHYCKRGE